MSPAAQSSGARAEGQGTATSVWLGSAKGAPAVEQLLLVMGYSWTSTRNQKMKSGKWEVKRRDTMIWPRAPLNWKIADFKGNDNTFT